jgi:uncharacterized membrane protein HdeD (DUF308 family)
MKIFGFLLIIAGFIMLVVRAINYTQGKKIVDTDIVKISVKENKTLTWPLYAGVIAIVAGITLVLVDRRGYKL